MGDWLEVKLAIFDEPITTVYEEDDEEETNNEECYDCGEDVDNCTCDNLFEDLVIEYLIDEIL